MLKKKTNQGKKNKTRTKIRGFSVKLPGKEHHFAKGSCGQLLDAFRPESAVPLRWRPLFCISYNKTILSFLALEDFSGG
jgi:hypothetical protein